MTRWRRLAVLAGLYVAQGLPWGFFTQAVPVLLRQAGVSLELVGASHLLALPWALKFLAGPALDRRARTSGRRGVLAALQLLSVALLLALSAWPGVVPMPALLVAVLLLNALAAVQDVGTDGLAVTLLPESERGLGNGLQVAAYRLGMIIGGGAILLVAERSGSRAALLALAVVLAVASLPLLLLPRKEAETKAIPTLVTPPPTRLGLPGGATWLAVLLTYKAGEALAGGMLRPALVDAGATLSDIAWLFGTVGSAAGLVGALAGGLFASRVAARHALPLAGLAQAVAVGVVAWCAHAGFTAPALVIGVEHFASGVATAVLFTRMMGACRPGAEATDYAVQSCLVVVSTGAAAALSGVGAAQLGYVGVFTLAAALSAVSALFAWRALRVPPTTPADVTAVYAGTFDPITNGHLSVVRQAARLHRRVVVLVADNPAKSPTFSPDERVALIRAEVAGLPNVEVDRTAGLVVDYARRIGARVLVRGLRGATDADAETALARANRTLAPEIDTIFVPAIEELADVSSSGLKALVRQGRSVRTWCPERVERRLREKLGVASQREAA